MDSNKMNFSIRVAIVGAGPSGLTLACILKESHIPFTVFELDASRSARGQGGMLDIHKNSGQLALKKAGLYEEFRKRMRVDATDLHVRDQTGKTVYFHTEKEEEDPERPEIDRSELRNMLLSPLHEGDVKWGKKLTRAEKDESGKKFTLHFADGTSAGGFDILVGADGTWSKVRPLRSDVPPPYVGMTVVTSNIANVDIRYPELGRFLGNGTCLLADGETIITAQKNGDGSAKTYSFIKVAEDWKEKSGIDWSNQREGLREYVERFHGDWVEEGKALMMECDEGDLAIRPLYLYPSSHKLEKKCSGVTLMGDAAHVITPFTGTGVNIAMHDAYDLGLALEKVAFEGAAIDDVLESYEDQMLERSGYQSDKCLTNQHTWLGGKSVQAIVGQMAEMFGRQK